MENRQIDKDAQFNCFLNKVIIYSSKEYFRKQMNISGKEKTIVDDENYSSFLHNFTDLNSPSFSLDKLEYSLQIKDAISSLSAIEQAVIFLLYEEELSQIEAAKILEIYSKTVSKIKKRAIEKLREFFEEDLEDGKQ